MVESRLVAHPLIISKAHMNNLFIIKVKFLVLIKQSHRKPPTMLTIKPRMVIIAAMLYLSHVYLISYPQMIH